MSHKQRDFKIKLWHQDPCCHWCKRPTILTNIKAGTLPGDAATIDHIYSRYDARRWVKQKAGETRKVLSCSACNNLKSKLETARLTREDLFRRGQGFALNPKRKRLIFKTFDTLEEVIAHFRENGIDITEKRGMITAT